MFSQSSPNFFQQSTDMLYGNLDVSELGGVHDVARPDGIVFNEGSLSANPVVTSDITKVYADFYHNTGINGGATDYGNPSGDDKEPKDGPNVSGKKNNTWLIVGIAVVVVIVAVVAFTSKKAVAA